MTSICTELFALDGIRAEQHAEHLSGASEETVNHQPSSALSGTEQRPGTLSGYTYIRVVQPQHAFWFRIWRRPGTIDPAAGVCTF